MLHETLEPGKGPAEAKKNKQQNDDYYKKHQDGCYGKNFIEFHSYNLSFSVNVPKLEFATCNLIAGVGLCHSHKADFV
jgi:hypothetical protein